MDLISAIKSGKPFKRKEWSSWISVNYPQTITKNLTLEVRDVIANDFEIQEEKIELTAEQIRSAFVVAWEKPYKEEVLSQMLKELGFKE